MLLERIDSCLRSLPLLAGIHKVLSSIVNTINKYTNIYIKKTEGSCKEVKSFSLTNLVIL